PKLSERAGCTVYLKYEGLNPTGSFKDRGMTLAISKAVEDGAKAVVCASTGNTSASAAAYATRAGLTCAVLIPEGYIALGKLAQALIHGAIVLQIRGNFDEALALVRQLADKGPETIATAIRIGDPASWDGAVRAADESSGSISAVTDAEILEAYRFLAGTEGVFCEPASAASVAGLLKAGPPFAGATVVCTLTGH